MRRSTANQHAFSESEVLTLLRQYASLFHAKQLFRDSAERHEATAREWEDRCSTERA